MTAAALLELCDNNDLLFDMSRSARRFALDYSWSIIARQWDQLFQNHLMKPNAKIRATITPKVARSNGYDCLRNISRQAIRPPYCHLLALGCQPVRESIIPIWLLCHGS
jgi:hypothetical protein